MEDPHHANLLISMLGIYIGAAVVATAAAAPGQTGGDPLVTVQRSDEGHIHWSFGNESFLRQVSLGPDGLSCTSLLNRRTGREWIHPTAASDEFRVDLETQSGEVVVLVGLGTWKYSGHTTGTVAKDWRELRIVIETEEPAVAVTRTYRWHTSLPIVREWTSVRNQSDRPVVVRQLDTFRLRVSPTLDDLTLHWMNNYPRGMLPARGTVVHQRRISENVEHFIRSGPYSPDCGWFCLTTPGEDEGLIGGWEWSGPMAVGFGDMIDPSLIKGYVYDELAGVDGRFGDLTSPCLIHGGLEPAGMRELLPAGSSIESPIGWCGFYQGDIDEAAALSHALVRTTLGPALPARDYPWVGYCSWSSSMDTAETSRFVEKGTNPWFPTQENLLSQVEAAADLGCELFIWDYGWFPRIGDWWIDKARFPDGARTVADAVHGRGMKLGLWVGFGCANEEAGVVRDHSDWLAEYEGEPWPGGFPQMTGASMWGERALCLGHRPVIEWVKQRLSAVIEEFEVDWLKHDFDVITLCDSRHHTHTPGDGRIAACAGFYEVMDHVGEKHPKVVCENWMNSTGVPDYGVLQRHHVQLIGDAYKPFLLRQMFYGHLQIFPADRQHRYLRLDRSKAGLRYMIRSVSMGGPWTLLSDPRLFTAEQKRTFKEEIARYKRLRPLSVTGRVYRLIGRPHPRGWDATEFWDVDRGEGVVYVFRNAASDGNHAVVAKGLNGDSRYRLEFVDGGQSITLSGEQLMTRGFPVELPEQNTCEVITLRRVE